MLCFVLEEKEHFIDMLQTRPLLYDRYDPLQASMHPKEDTSLH